MRAADRARPGAGLLPPGCVAVHPRRTPRGAGCFFVSPAAIHPWPALICGAIAATLLAAAPARALDGWADLRGYRQQGRAGTSAYTTRSVQSEGRLDERIDFSRALYLQIRYGALREANWSDFDGAQSDYETITQQPNAILTFRRDTFRLGLSADGYRRDYYGAGLAGRRDDRLEYGLWSQYEIGRLRLNLRWFDAELERRDDSGIEASRTRERTGSAGARLTLPAGGDLAYTYTENDHYDRALDSRNLFRTHAIEYRGTLAVGDRVRLSWDAQTRFFTQTLTGPLTGGRNLLLPLTGGYRIDDTPLIEDPLEASTTQVSALYDNDRTTPTTINIGDAATVGHEFGGDARNLRYDFGVARELGLALLYVDRLVVFNRLIHWRAYVSDDPEGRIWTELPDSAATITWREWDASLRGWQIDFPVPPGGQPVRARFFKLVDAKDGPTLPDLYVTELEVYDRQEASRAGSRESTVRQRVDTDLVYQFARDWQFRYALHLDEQRYDNDVNNLSGTGQSAQLRWARRLWSAGASFESQRLRSASRADTDTRLWGLNAARGNGTRLTTGLSWIRQDDRSRELPRVTDTYALQSNYTILPALTVSERVTYGRVRDEAYGGGSRAWVVTGLVRSAPRPNLGIDLWHTRRWIDDAAGAGFTPYNESESLVRWSPWPLVSLSSQVRYQVREDADWLVRHLASWTPLVGGSMELQLSLDDFRDTRADLSQRGGGFTLTWRPRARLTLEAGLEKTRFKQRGELSWPLSSNARVNWTF
ncbi:MAG: hypothetical protein ACYDIE_08735 [Candidatus Krumholzibacteriia bacterium]